MNGHLNARLLPPLARKTDSRIVFVVLDGLGGVLSAEPTALQRATIPNLDALAAESALGRTIPVAEGITPGSGPGHFALFGYDPLEMDVGRGLLEALGLGVDVDEGDVAIRGNYCTLDSRGRLLDRRAGRIATEKSRKITATLDKTVQALDGVRVEVHPGLQHRFAVVLRGTDLDGGVADTDPQKVGVAPLVAQANHRAAEKTARVANAFINAASGVLGAREEANGVLLRGFSGRPPLPTYAAMAKLHACAIAAYPAYRGVASMLGMKIRKDIGPGSSIADEVTSLEEAWKDAHDFFFLHVKGTDSAGEDGDTERKAQVIEAFDKELPRIRALKPDVLVVTGDHATPGPLAAHSWHAVPTLLCGPWMEPDEEQAFDEVHCHRGRLGAHFPATALLRMAMASAGKLAKFGA